MAAGPGRRVVTVALVAVGALLAGLAVLWAGQRRLIFQPGSGAVPPAGTLLAGAVDVTLTTADGLMLTALYRPHPDGDRTPGPDGDPWVCRTTVLVAPGNAGHRGDRVPLARALTGAGFGVLLLDYRGYGGNPGSPTEAGLALDVAAARAFLVGPAGLAAREILYLGESLGAAVVTAAALTEPPAGLVLRSPFTELADVARRQIPVLPVGLLLRDRFPVVTAIGEVRAPVTVVYGTADHLVPPDQSVAVARAAAAVEVPVAGAGHNDPALAHGPAVVAAVLGLADRIGCPPASR